MERLESQIRLELPDLLVYGSLYLPKSGQTAS